MRCTMGRKRKSSSPDTWLPASKALKKEDMVCNSLLATETDGHLKQRSALPAPGSDGEEEEEECDVDYVRPSQCSPAALEEDRELHLFITVDGGAGAHRPSREQEGDPSMPWGKDAEEGLSCLESWSPSNDQPSEEDGDDDDDEDDEFGQLDVDLERKSREHNLTSGNIRSILHEVITNEHVVAMMKAAIRETQDLPLFEPKMTRSRLKKVVEQGESIHNLSLSPIRGAITKPPQFVDIPLEEEEDSSDEEYCPDEDEDDETAEESFLSDVDSLGSSPVVSRGRVPGTSRQQPGGPLEQAHSATKRPKCSRHLRVDAVPMGPPPPPPFSSSTPPSSPHHHLLLPAPTDSSFLERLHAVEEELNLSHDSPSYQGLNEVGGASGLVALRTRSKRPLRDVPLGQLEAELRAPDITPDMYEQHPAILEEDIHWTHWLQGLMASDNEEEGDDDDDPEYVFLEDVDVPDKEDYRTDRAVRITKKEVNQLLEELFDTFQDEEVVVDEVDGEEEELSLQHAVLKYNVPQALRFEAPLASMLTERRRVVREQYEAAQQKRALHDTPGHAPTPPTPLTATPTATPTVNLLPVTTLVLDHAQKLQLQQQVQQHVQLLTQVHLLSQHVESLHHEASVTKDYLEELSQCARRREEAQLPRQPGFLSSFRASNLQDALDLLQEVQLQEEATRGQAAPVGAQTWLPKKRSTAFPQLPADTAWLLATRPVFLYPELLPVRNLDPSKQPNLYQPRKKYTPGEDCLVALGLKHFEGTVLKEEQLCTYLLNKPLPDVRKHLVEMCGPNVPPGNAIKVFCERRELPAMPLACSAAVQGEQRPPVDRDFSLLPNWLKKSQAAIHGARLSSGPPPRYPRTLPRSCTLRLHPALSRKGGLGGARPSGGFALYHTDSLPLLASASDGHTQPCTQEVPPQAPGALPVQGVILLAQCAYTLVQRPSPLDRAMLVPTQKPVPLAAVYPASCHHHSARGAAASPATGPLHPPESSQSSQTRAPPAGRKTACRKQSSRQVETPSEAAPGRFASQPTPDHRGTTERRCSPPPPPRPRAATLPCPRANKEARARPDRALENAGQAHGQAGQRCLARHLLPDLPGDVLPPSPSPTAPHTTPCSRLTRPAGGSPLCVLASPHNPLTSPLPPPTPSSVTVTVSTLPLALVRPALLPQQAPQSSWTPVLVRIKDSSQMMWMRVQNQTAPPPLPPPAPLTPQHSHSTSSCSSQSTSNSSQSTSNSSHSTSNSSHSTSNSSQSTSNSSHSTSNSSQRTSSSSHSTSNSSQRTSSSSHSTDSSSQSTSNSSHSTASSSQSTSNSSQSTSLSSEVPTRSSFEEQLHRLVEGLREEPAGVEDRGGGEKEKEVTGERGEGEVMEEAGGAGSSTSQSVTVPGCVPPLHTLEEKEEKEEIDGRGEESRREAEETVETVEVEVETTEDDSSESALSSATTSCPDDQDSVASSDALSDGGAKEGETEEGGGGEEETSGEHGGGEERGEEGGGEERGEGGGEERGEERGEGGGEESNGGQSGEGGAGGGGGGGGGGEESNGQRDGDAGGGGGGGAGEEEGDGDYGQSGGERDEDKDGDGGERDEDKDGDGEPEEEEEDFDDLTQDEDEEEVMSSASEESVLSVPELQETMKKLTWLASEGRLCGDVGDSEEDHDSPASPGSPGSQEDNSEEEEAKAEEEDGELAAGQGRGSKATEEEEEEEVASGEGTPRRSGKGPGRGRGRARAGSLRRSRRQERHSKDTSKLLLLYDQHILDNDPLRDSKDTAFAQAYLTRVREALQDAPGKMEEFLGLLYDFEQTGEGRDVVQLFRNLRSLLAEQPHLLRDFAAFLHPEQALECGLFEEQQAFERSRRFLRQLEISFGENPSHYQKIIKALQGGVNLSQASIHELKSQMAALLKGHTHLQGEFWVFFDELRPPPARPGQFEEAHWPEEGGGGSDGGEPVGGGGLGGGASCGFEEVTLPDLEEEEELHKIRPMAARRRRRKIGSHGNYKECDWSDKDCPCPCHESSHDAKLRKHRRKGCPRCHGNKTSDGVPRAVKSLDPLYSLSVSPTANRLTESSLEEGAEKDRELEAELKEELDSDVNSPLPERGAASWEGVEETPFPPAEGAGGKEDKEEPEEMEEDEEEKKDDRGGGEASPVASPVARKRRRGAGEGGGGGEEGGEEEEERHVSSSPSSDSPALPSPPPAPTEPPVPAKNISLTPSGQKVILWTREADRVILTTCQQEGANQSTFQAISTQLGNKTPNEVSRRFRDLMQLFHTAARQTNSEDEAPPTEPPSTNEEEAGVK